MYKHASRFHQSQPDLNVPAHQEREPKRAEWAVVAFRMGCDNQRRERVYRRVWTFRSRHDASRHLSTLGAVYPCAIVVHKGAPCSIVDHELVDRWMAQRRGVNAHANPWSASKYADRERQARESWTDEMVT